MTVFLIQTNGHDISEAAAPEYREGAKGDRFVDEPLRYHRYFNASPYWQRDGYDRSRAWERASAGDVALLYCSSSVEEHTTCLSHVLPIRDKQIDSGGALLEFETAIQCQPKLGYQEIQDLVARDQFSDRMRFCGQQGFNFTYVKSRDFETVKRLTDPLGPEGW